MASASTAGSGLTGLGGLFLIAYGVVGSSLPFLGFVEPGHGVDLALALMPAWIVSLGVAALFRRLAPGSAGSAASLLASVVIVAYEAGCLVAFATPQAAPALAGLVALTCVAHGHQGRATLAHPYFLLADGLGLLGSALWVPAATHGGFLALGGASGIVAGIVVGTSAFESQRARTRADAMRNAVQAGIAAERFAKTAELEGIVLDARARSHDVGNALMAALLTVEILTDALEQKEDPLAEDVSSARDALKAALGLSKRGQPSGGGPHGEPVAVATALEPIAHAAPRTTVRVTFGRLPVRRCIATRSFASGTSRLLPRAAKRRTVNSS